MNLNLSVNKLDFETVYLADEQAVLSRFVIYEQTKEIDSKCVCVCVSVCLCVDVYMCVCVKSSSELTFPLEPNYIIRT